MWIYNQTEQCELYHYGVPGMKWGIRKSVYKSMNRQQRKEIRKNYYKTPEGKVAKATTIGTILGGPIGGLIAGSIANKKINSISKKTIDKGKKEVEKNKNTKFETDEEKILKLQKEGKTNPNANYLFDQNGNLFMVTWN